MSWSTKRDAARAARAHEVACDHCSKRVASTMKRGPPRGWIADATRQVTEVAGDGYRVTRASVYCSRTCANAGPRRGAA